MTSPEKPTKNAQEPRHGVRIPSEGQDAGRKKKRKTKRVSASTWAELKIAFVSGNGLRELARKTGIPEGTILSRASREGWGKQIQNAKTLIPKDKRPSVSEAIVVTRRERGERYQDRMAGVVERMIPLLEKMSPGELLDLSTEIDRLDKVGRRSFGLDSLAAETGGRTLNLSINLDDLDDLHLARQAEGTVTDI